MKKWLLLGLVSLSLSVQAQKKYGLQECVDIAFQNNLQLKQGQLQVQNTQNTLEQSNYVKYPNLNFSGGEGYQSGRNIDPFTNQFVEKGVNFANFGLNAGVTLYNGYQIKNTVKQNQTNVKASQKDLEVTKNTIALNVANAYLGLLNNYEQLDISRLQVEATKLQLERVSKLVRAGSLPQSNEFDLQAQLANDELVVINNQNTIEISKLTLKQLMNLPASEDIEIERVRLADPSTVAYDATLDQVYNAATKYLPDVEAAELRIESAKTSVEIAKSVGLPTLSLNGGINTSYSSAAPAQRFVGDGGASTVVEVPSETRYVQYLGIKVPVIEKVTVPSGSIQNFTMFDQFTNNRNTSLSLNLRVPIFNQYTAKYRMKGAQIQQKSAELQVQIIRNQIRQNVEQAYYSMLNAAKRFQATSKQVQSLELAFKAAESRLNAGAINSLDYNIAKTNLDRARGNVIQAKYDYVFRTKILDFYQNKPLTLN